MSGEVRVSLRPFGVNFTMPAGQLLADHLFVRGVEFPCGGRGRCRGCRVRVLAGSLAETAADLRQLNADERRAGWRLACQARPSMDLTIELRQWSALILADDSEFPFTPGEGLGIAVDVGTTTIVVQLLDLATARIMGTETALNPQARFGADVMSRIGAAADPATAVRMRDAVRESVAGMVAKLAAAAPAGSRIARATLVGNTAMHHLFLGHSLAPLAAYPFRPDHLEGAELKGAEIGWTGLAADGAAFFLPNLGGFVGSDILGVIIATGLDRAGVTAGGADLGTNGEIIFASKGSIVVASTAAGPAFEGARISQGMRAAPGAVDRVVLEGGGMIAHTIAGAEPRGICGSGLVDAVACGLEAGLIEPSGRLPGGSMAVGEAVALTQQDIREVQLAKGAIAAGIEILMREQRVTGPDLSSFHLAGAFGNSLDVENSRRIGLLPFPAAQVRSAGNAALLGAKMALFMPDGGRKACRDIITRVRHVSLETSADFQDLFAEKMTFPEKGETEK
jgi:uncharacterized 2Fe-2S/4Fe-4S cluster protein (DUF4445 family)